MRRILPVCAILLSSCGLIQDRSSDYVQATTGSEISIPAELSDQKIQSQYPIPEINNKRPLALEYELPKPPNATAALDEAPFTIDQVDDQIWLRLYLAPGKVWPLLDAFWSEHNISTLEENISEGYVVTDVVSDTSTLKKAIEAQLQEADDKPSENISLIDFSLENVYFQASLAQGIRRNTSEIKVRVLNARSSGVEKAWQAESADLIRDSAVLNTMGAFITLDALQNRYSMLANTIGGESRIQLLQNDQGQNYLHMSLSPQRAWNELEKALEAAGIIVADKDISAKTLYISYLSESEISKWYVSDETISEKRLERNFSIQLNIQEDKTIQVDIEQLNDAFDASLKNDLLALIFEHIS